MSRSPAPYGMLLDRGLTLEQLDLAYDIAVSDPDPKTNRKRLTMGLRDLVSEQEAEGKTKKCLTRVWLNPPPEAALMIRWARETTVPRSSRHVLHFGALLATFPFFGAVTRVVGQHFQTEGSVEASAVRAEVRRALGDRSSVDVAARKAYTTLRNIGIIDIANRSITPSDPVHAVPDGLFAWLAHALLLTRGADSLPASSVLSAPELLGLVGSGGSYRAYPLLESHSAADSAVLVRSST